MILEDDILSTSRYITAIREFIQMHRHHDWVGLKFTQYMIIGDLVRSSSLPRLVQLMTMFREEQPVDFIMSHFISMMVNAPGLPTRRVPSLFNHIGRRSTLANKTQKVVDYHTNQVTRRFEHDNPPAEVVTNMRVVTGHLAPYAYSVAPGLFIGQPKRGSVGTLDVALTRRRRLRRVAVVTGQKQQYRLKRGRLLAAADLVRVTGTSAECTDWSLLGEFDSSGVVDVKAVDKLVPGGVQCVRVEVDRTYGGIVAITEIALFEES
ncbi:Alpha-1,6-mannosyl-glycoprotein 4-beta-N-acetylglucosaminyltransferase [Amphibalanus amphitrite]|uniref:Alpha-1,6-mannosyl-glycoprotein 4-beta-N-acetylglucosaminyltransferase n=1 Tax=Amphibalanus amphitrite TaxID=1232801 RepID=A0A6A4X0N8_AMPAM|nr:Alpha-1,6-mannosyl-glycoprotein 4-beta-N-acetylglucosaminyltransferase [Amphibalanus amphitrite]